MSRNIPFEKLNYLTLCRCKTEKGKDRENENDACVRHFLALVKSMRCLVNAVEMQSCGKRIMKEEWRDD